MDSGRVRPFDHEGAGELRGALVELRRGNSNLVAAAAEVRRVLGDVPTAELRRLDQAVRQWWWWDSYLWPSISPADVATMAEASGDSLAVGEAASIHPDGHVREAAVRLLMAVRTGAELRWLLLRCFDWVEPIRVLAAAAVRDRVLDGDDTDLYVESLVDGLTLLLREGAFYENAQLRDDLVASLLDPGRRDALWTAAESADRRIRRVAVLMLTRTDPGMRLLRLQLEGDDIVATSTAATAALADADVGEEAACLLVHSSSARLREEGLWHLLTHGHDLSADLERLLTDRAPGVRSIAQRTWAEAGRDVRAWYLSRLEVDPAGAMLGLGEVGRADDMGIALSRLRDRRAAVRAAAVRLVARQGAMAQRPLLIEIATNESSRLAWEAIGGLTRLGLSDSVGRELWDRAVASGPDAARRRAAAVLVRRCSRWQGLETGLETAGSEDGTLSDLGAEMVRRVVTVWNRSGTSPSPGQLDRIETHLGAASRKLGHGLRDDLAEIVRTWRR